MFNYIMMKVLKGSLVRLRGFILREIIWSEHTLYNVISSLSLLLLTPLSRTSIGSTISDRVRRALGEHRAKYIQRKYNIKLLYPPNTFPSDIFWRDYFQVPEFLKGNEAVIDVGATIGDFAIIMAKAFNVRKVIAIEPDEHFYFYLIKNIKLNHLEHVIIPLNTALGAKVGTITLYKAGSFLSRREGMTARTYPCTTLDKVVESLGVPKVDLIKIDTEGSELDILRGAANLLHRAKPKIIIEVHSKEDKDKVIRYLQKYGYELMHEKVNFPCGFAGFDYIAVLYFWPQSPIEGG